MDESKYQKLKIEDVTEIPNESGHYEIYKNNYWICKDGFIYLYKGSPMCNSDYGVSKLFVDNKKFPGNEIIFLEIVFLDHDCHNYVY